MKTALSAGLVCLLSVAALRAEVDLPGKRLGQLAARAVEKHAWGALRHYAESGLDSERRGQAYFVLGYREYEAREYPAAAEDLRRARKTGVSLADLATYYGASAARQAGQSDQAIEALDGFSGRYPGSTLRFDALALLADLWLETGQAERAIGALTAESQVRQRPPLALLLARAYRDAGQPEEAARRFQEVYYAFPASAESKAAGDALHQLRAELGAHFPEVSEDIQTARAALLYAKSLVNDALSDYEALLQAYPGSRLVPRWKVARAGCLLRLKQADRAIEGLQEKFAADPEADAQRLATLVEAHLQRADTAAMLQTLEELRALYPQSASCASALSLVGNRFVREGDWKTASNYYEPLAQGFPDSDFAAEASWRVAWARFLEKEFTPAAEALVNHLAGYPDSPRVPAALYWLGRMVAERGATPEARAWYVLLGTRFVHSYYALQATQRLAELAAAGEPGEGGEESPAPTPTTALAHQLPPRPPAPVPACAPATPSESLRPFLTLKALSLEDLGEQYLLALLPERPEASELLLALSRLKAEQRNPSAALLNARRAVPRYAEYEFSELPHEVWNLLYPRNYWELVRRQARANGLDPYLVMGLIRQESAFNPRATSSANARGLMQILPQTASRSRRRRARVARRLYEPAYNVRFGCRYLRGLLNAFGGNLEQALAAYHAGDFRVRDWLGKYSFREPAEFMETIPISATRAYVEAVLRDAAIYRELLTGAAKFAKCQPAVAKSGGRSRRGRAKLLP
jgi:soluble lytic murein transglycosylase